MTACIKWDKYTMPSGYGLVYYRGKTRYAHRIVFAEHTETDIDLLNGHVMHTCDNPSCVNPEHLVLGTQQDNMDDKVAKGRQSKGSGHAHSKLTEDDVLRMRRRFVKHCRINGPAQWPASTELCRAWFHKYAGATHGSTSRFRLRATDNDHTESNSKTHSTVHRQAIG